MDLFLFPALSRLEAPSPTIIFSRYFPVEFSLVTLHAGAPGGRQRRWETGNTWRP